MCQHRLCPAGRADVRYQPYTPLAAGEASSPQVGGPALFGVRMFGFIVEIVLEVVFEVIVGVGFVVPRDSWLRGVSRCVVPAHGAGGRWSQWLCGLVVLLAPQVLVAGIAVSIQAWSLVPFASGWIIAYILAIVAGRLANRIERLDQ